MQVVDFDGFRVHYRIDGDPNGAPVVFVNSLGTDLRLWDKVIARLPQTGLKYIRYDMRGHGLTNSTKPPYGMGMLVRDAEQMLDHLGLRDTIFVGLSIGGMIAQGLAAKRLDLVRAMVLSNTGARIGTRAMWDDRIAAVEAGGIEALADAVMERWFSTRFRQTAELAAWRNMLTRTSANGYVGCSHAIAGTDFYSTTAALRLPTLGIAGSEDGSTPPDLVRETVNLVPGSQFHLIRKAGHLPCVEAPDEFANLLAAFIAAQAH
ncbi:MAG: 3-oxoadipate enol-lactonase [Marivita sp.]|uniref:3-oxoadipate enol-lactonase n=1 Tax=Marivita sp. TaxID=2003365 RepID=UPI003EF87008